MLPDFGVFGAGMAESWEGPRGVRSGFPVISGHTDAYCGSIPVTFENQQISRPKVINSTVRNASASKGLFQRWLWSSAHNDRRRIEEIPPVDLDRYLAEFFFKAKKRNGQDYDASSLRRIRAGLQFYLREAGYQCSIIRSPAFAGSAEAIKIRCQELCSSNMSTMSPPRTAADNMMENSSVE